MTLEWMCRRYAFLSASMATKEPNFGDSIRNICPVMLMTTMANKGPKTKITFDYNLLEFLQNSIIKNLFQIYRPIFYRPRVCGPSTKYELKLNSYLLFSAENKQTICIYFIVLNLWLHFNEYYFYSQNLLKSKKLVCKKEI